MQVLAGGHVNCIIKASNVDVGDEGAVIVRAVGKSSCLGIRENPATLETVMRVAEAGGVGAAVLAKFNNGLVYDYTIGELLNPDVIPHTHHIQKEVYIYVTSN